MSVPSEALAPHGWDDRVAEATAGFVRPGRVVRVEYGAAVVRTAAGEVVADWTGPTSRQRGIGSSPAVGDWVDVVVDDEAGDDDEGHAVGAVAERWSALVRHDPADAHRAQVLAANVDVIFVVVAGDRPLNVRRLDRMLAMAWGSGARPVVVVTKRDLAGDLDEGTLDEVAGAADWVAASGTTGEGVDELRRRLGSGTAVFLGPSGVGKSTLVNALAGEPLMETGEVRGRDGKGRHVTTTRELWPLPGGGVVIDTPGIRGVQLWDPEGGIDVHFADLADLAAGCRFGDCSHAGEPGCAVVAAVDDGRATAERVERWLDLRAESHVWQERQVEHERSERRGRSRRR